jgi:aspartyl-tRNA(Asn)/glutamyl-tRNA(Gln) amidotransferase subunit A
MTDLNIYITKKEISSSEDGLLNGERVAVKDNICLKGTRTTCGSAILSDYRPPYDATVVRRLKKQGATITGKTNMDEFGMGTTTETSNFGLTKNPVDEEYVPGGSSGGSAAAVASGDVDMALGTDTGGSVRCPASFCGVFGLKPTYGLVSRYGLIAYANSLEQIGPIASSVEGIAKLLTVISGTDNRDQTTIESEVKNYTKYAEKPQSYTIGIPTQLVEGVDKVVEEAFWNSIDSLESSGFNYQEVSMPSLESAVEAYYVIAMSEASSNLARFDGIRYGQKSDEGSDWNENFSETRGEGFGDEVKRRVMLGTYATSEGYKDNYYDKAQKVREKIRYEFEEKFSKVDIVATPTMPVTPFRIGDSLDDPLKMYLADANTTPVNLSNLPAISVPTNQSNELPVGLQMIGPSFSEPKLIKAARLAEDKLH